MDINTLKILWEKCIIGLAEVDENGKFIKANPAFCAILGYSEAELLHKTWIDITHPEDAPGTSAMLSKLLSGEIEEYSVQKRYITKKGNIVWIDLLLTSIKVDNTSIYFLKQVQTSPIIIPTSDLAPVDKENLLKNNSKLIVAGIIGAILAVLGVFTGNTEMQTIGVGLIIGVFGNFIGKYK